MGWLRASRSTNCFSDGFVAPRLSSARTTAEFRTRPIVAAIRCWWRPVRRWSMKIEVSKTTKLLIMPREFELSAVSRHQLLEALQGDNFAQRRVYRLGSRFDP